MQGVSHLVDILTQRMSWIVIFVMLIVLKKILYTLFCVSISMHNHFLTENELYSHFLSTIRSELSFLMKVCIHIYVYIHVYIIGLNKHPFARHVYISTYMCIYIHTYIHIYIIGVHIYKYVHTYTYIHISTSQASTSIHSRGTHTNLHTYK